MQVNAYLYMEIMMWMAPLPLPACTSSFAGFTHPEMVDYYVPHRYKEGYGISLQGIEYAKEHEAGLMISLDCGIKSAELIQYAKTLGIDFIVCDHHLPGAIAASGHCHP